MKNTRVEYPKMTTPFPADENLIPIHHSSNSTMKVMVLSHLHLHFILFTSQVFNNPLVKIILL